MKHPKGPLRHQWLQQNQDSVRKWVDPAYQGVLAIRSATKPDTGPANAIDSLPIPTPQAPVGAADPQVLTAQSDFAKANLRKKSVANTVRAGETGGFKPGEAGYPGNPGPAVASYKK